MSKIYSLFFVINSFLHTLLTIHNLNNIFTASLRIKIVQILGYNIISVLNIIQL